MHPLIRSITRSELEFIALLDYGLEKEKHLAALEKLIFEQGGVSHADQSWFPCEVVELGSNSLQPGHEREFVICTLLVIASIKSGFCNTKELDQMLSDRSADYDSLPKELSETVLTEYLNASC